MITQFKEPAVEALALTYNTGFLPKDTFYVGVRAGNKWMDHKTLVRQAYRINDKTKTAKVVHADLMENA